MFLIQSRQNPHGSKVSVWLNLAALLCIGIGALYSSPVLSSGSVYSLDQLIAIGLNQNPAVLASRDQVDAARGGATAARAYPNPEISGQTGNGRERNVATPISGQAYNLSLNQPIEMPNVRSARIDAADATVVATDAARQGFEDDASARIKLAFFDLLRREAEERATHEDLQLTQQIRDRIALRHKVGESPRFDLIRADTEMLNAQRAHEAAILRVDIARANLRTAVGQPLPDGWRIKGELPKKISLPPLARLKEELLARNPSLARSEAERQAAERRVDLEKSQRLPKVSLIATRDVDPTIQKSTAGLALTVPIWDFRSGQISQARAELSRANHQLAAQKMTLAGSLESTYRLYQIASNQVNILENQVLAQAGAAQRIAEAAYRYGERGILEWLDAQRTYRAARNELITARYELATVSVEIDRLRSISNSISNSLSNSTSSELSPAPSPAASDALPRLH